MSGPVVRKTVKHVETTFIEVGKPAATPVKMVAMAAVIENPWAGQGYVEDQRSNILKFAPPLADVPVPPLLDALGGPDEIVVALGGASSGRAHPRIGNRYMDMEEMGITSNTGLGSADS